MIAGNGLNGIHDESYLSANSGVNLITGNFDNSFILSSDTKNLFNTTINNNNNNTQN